MPLNDQEFDAAISGRPISPDSQKWIVEWDLVAIGGYKTLHGPFNSEAEAEAWVNEEVDEETLEFVEIMSVDQEFLISHKIVPPDETASDEHFYRRSDI